MTVASMDALRRLPQARSIKSPAPSPKSGETRRIDGRDAFRRQATVPSQVAATESGVRRARAIWSHVRLAQGPRGNPATPPASAEKPSARLPAVDFHFFTIRQDELL